MRKGKGIIRKIDKLGRVVIPKKIRDEFEIVENSPLEVLVESNAIRLKKFIPSCVFCGSIKNITEFKEKIICEECRKNLYLLHNRKDVL